MVSTRRKLTLEQVQWARGIVAKRAELERQLALLPSIPQVAATLGVSVSCLRNLLTARFLRVMEADKPSEAPA